MIDWLVHHPKVSALPVLGAAVPIATAISKKGILLTDRRVEAPTIITGSIRRETAMQVLSCGIAGASVYLLWHYAVLATVFKISVFAGAVLLGGASFFIAPAVVLGIYALCIGCSKLYKSWEQLIAPDISTSDSDYSSTTSITSTSDSDYSSTTSITSTSCDIEDVSAESQ